MYVPNDPRLRQLVLRETRLTGGGTLWHGQNHLEVRANLHLAGHDRGREGLRSNLRSMPTEQAVGREDARTTPTTTYSNRSLGGGRHGLYYRSSPDEGKA